MAHATAIRDDDMALSNACFRALHILAEARRQHRYAITPAVSDAIDNAMDRLSYAAAIAAREARHVE